VKFFLIDWIFDWIFFVAWSPSPSYLLYYNTVDTLYERKFFLKWIFKKHTPLFAKKHSLTPTPA